MIRYLLPLLAVSCFAQNVTISPDCFFFARLTATGRTPTLGFHNTAGCVAWTVTYNSIGFSALSLRLESANDNAAGTAAGTWGTFAGTVQTGANPNTSTTNAYTVMLGFNPWVSLNLTAATGTGTITAYVYGYRAPFTFSSTSGGPTSDVNVIQVGGVAVTLGQALMAGSFPVAIASNQTGLPNPCTSSASLSTSSSGSTQIVALTGGQTIKICNVDVVSDGSSSIKLVYGTGANCAVGSTDITPAFTNLTSWSNDYAKALAGAVSNAVCLNQTTTSTTTALLTYIKE